MENTYVNEYLKIAQQKFNSCKNPLYAEKMKAYMRNQFEFLGLNSPIRKDQQRIIIKEAGLPVYDLLPDIVQALWISDEREYQYFAMELLSRRIKKAPKEIILLLEELILTKSWWDTIDYLAAKLVGTVFKNYPESIKPVTRRWMDSGNIWLQRSCLLFQLKYRKSTDLKILYSFIDQLSHEKEFFIKKAIGWALREYSKVDPQEVGRFIRSRDLQALSVKEGMKYVGRMRE